jgi:hypothetical protein
VFFTARVYNLRPYRQTERGALYRMGFIMSNGLKIERRWLQSLINLSRGVLHRQRCSSPPWVVAALKAVAALAVFFTANVSHFFTPQSHFNFSQGGENL